MDGARANEPTVQERKERNGETLALRQAAGENNECW